MRIIGRGQLTRTLYKIGCAVGCRRRWSCRCPDGMKQGDAVRQRQEKKVGDFRACSCLERRPWPSTPVNQPLIVNFNRHQPTAPWVTPFMVFNSLIVQVARPRDQLVLYVPLRPACCAHHQPVPSSPFVLPCCIRLHDDAKDPLALPWRRDPSSRRRFAIPVHPSASTNPLTPHKKKETYDLFAHSLPSHSLGFIDPKAPTLDLTIAGRDLVIHQSPGILSSNRAGGTTGAGTYPTPSPHPTPPNPN